MRIYTSYMITPHQYIHEAELDCHDMEIFAFFSKHGNSRSASMLRTVYEWCDFRGAPMFLNRARRIGGENVCVGIYVISAWCVIP